MNEQHESIREQVREKYGNIAQTQNTSCSCGPSSGCCGSKGVSASPEQLAKAFGYNNEELGSIPEGANMGLSCGNPVALATLREGETVLDLGSGGGFDVFIAGRKVGATGKAIGVDMTPEMLTKARRNIAAYKTRTGLDNVEFRLGEIEHLPIADSTVDVIISNCVINLSPDKQQVWREMARVLKPGGRVSVSDIAIMRELPADTKASLEAYIGCIAGAVTPDETRSMIAAAGLEDAVMEIKKEAVDNMFSWSDPVFGKPASGLPAGGKPSDYIASVAISARKPR
jgi:ubiquinone/menaquinone biosynthesis C-methylase UbiE